MDKRVLVVACNHAQFRHWCAEHNVNPRKVRFVGDGTMIEGFNSDSALIVFAGQFWLQQNLDRLAGYVATRFPHIKDWFSNPDELQVARMIKAGLLK